MLDTSLDFLDEIAHSCIRGHDERPSDRYTRALLRKVRTLIASELIANVCWKRWWILLPYEHVGGNPWGAVMRYDTSKVHTKPPSMVLVILMATAPILLL